MSEHTDLSGASRRQLEHGVPDREIGGGDAREDPDLGWRQRREKELALMKDLVPMLKKRAQGREISGLSAYE